MDKSDKSFGSKMIFKLKFPFETVSNTLLSKTNLGSLLFKCLVLLNEAVETDSYSLDYLQKKVMPGKLEMLIKFKRQDNYFNLSLKLIECEETKFAVLQLSLTKSIKFSVADFGKCFSAELKELTTELSHTVKASSLFSASIDVMHKFFVNPKKEDYKRLFCADIEGDLLKEGNKLKIDMPGQYVVATCLKQTKNVEETRMWDVTCDITVEKGCFSYEVFSKLIPLGSNSCFYEAETICDKKLTIEEVNQYKKNNVQYLAVLKKYSEEEHN